MPTTELTTSVYPSPIGDIQLVYIDNGLCYLDFADNPERMERLLKTRFGNYQLKPSENAPSVHQALDHYFAGDKDPFGSIALDTAGTEFQEKVWQVLTSIPSGATMDYSGLANQAGNPRAVRAAASSNARNPISIIIPCHRVIGKDGSLRGYAGGESRKRWLLQHEGVQVQG